MTQSLILIVLFMGALIGLPFLIDRLKKHYGWGPLGPAGASQVVSALSVGPQQRVVTVEVGPAHARVCLVLGVTPQQVQCLHSYPVGQAPAVAAPTAPSATPVAAPAAPGRPG